jgi:16S rRNA U1498 N3-methylase RsmE
MSIAAMTQAKGITLLVILGIAIIAFVILAACQYRDWKASPESYERLRTSAARNRSQNRRSRVAGSIRYLPFRGGFWLIAGAITRRRDR